MRPKTPENCDYKSVYLPGVLVEQNYRSQPHTQLFSVIAEHICPSGRAEVPDSKLVIFRRDNQQWGFAATVCPTVSQGVIMLPCIQCEVYETRSEAYRAGLEKFIELAGDNKRLLKWAE